MVSKSIEGERPNGFPGLSLHEVPRPEFYNPWIFSINLIYLIKEKLCPGKIEATLISVTLTNTYNWSNWSLGRGVQLEFDSRE